MVVSHIHIKDLCHMRKKQANFHPSNYSRTRARGVKYRSFFHLQIVNFADSTKWNVSVTAVAVLPAALQKGSGNCIFSASSSARTGYVSNLYDFKWYLYFNSESSFFIQAASFILLQLILSTRLRFLPSI